MLMPQKKFVNNQQPGCKVETLKKTTNLFTQLGQQIATSMGHYKDLLYEFIT